MKRAIKNHLTDFVALLLLGAVATGVALYVLNEQRLRFPVLEDAPHTLKAEFVTAQAVTPGQGQTVRVSGVRIGDIGDVELKDGRAVIRMDIDAKYSRLVREDATAFLRPKTGLKDMFIELYPGTKKAPIAKQGFVVPIHNTLPDVNEDEILSALDKDTRDYIKLLLNGVATGLRGRGDDLRAVFKRFEPTQRDIALVSGEVRKRRVELRRLINSLARLNKHLGTRDDELAELVDSSAKVFRQFAAEKGNVSATVRELPGTLRQLSSTLTRVEDMARILGPTSDKLRPAVRALHESNQEVAPFAREAAPQIERDIRPFVREARPLVRELNPTVENLVAAEPFLTRSFRVLNHFFNMLAHNPNGPEPPEKADRDEGYLFHFAWVSHQSNLIFANTDAHGPLRAITLGGTCATLAGTARSQPEIEFLLGLTGVLTDPRVCGNRDVTDNPPVRQTFGDLRKKGR